MYNLYTLFARWCERRHFCTVKIEKQDEKDCY